jgi:putative thioredoxin
MIDASATGWVIDVDEENFEQEVVERSKSVPVVLDFWAPWCQPCRTLGPVLEKIAEAKAGAFVLAKVNIDESQNLAGYFGIEGVPTVHALKDGQFIQGFAGIPDEQVMKEFFGLILPSETENAVKEAHELETTDSAKSEKIYREILTKEPDNELARLGLARLLVGKQHFEEAAQLISPLGTIGDLGTEAERLRRIIELQGAQAPKIDETALRRKIAAEPDNARPLLELGSALATQARYPEALETLIKAAELDKTLAKNEVRELMVKIFQIIGVRSEMADDYRARLQSLLY